MSKSTFYTCDACGAKSGNNDEWERCSLIGHWPLYVLETEAYVNLEITTEAYVRLGRIDADLCSECLKEITSRFEVAVKEINCALGARRDLVSGGPSWLDDTADMFSPGIFGLPNK